MKIAPSILSADFAKLGEEIQKVHAAGADYIHLDVMDGMFVPNMSFGFDIVKLMHGVTKMPMDVHMMTSAPQKYIEVLLVGMRNRMYGKHFVKIHA